MKIFNKKELLVFLTDAHSPIFDNIFAINLTDEEFINEAEKEKGGVCSLERFANAFNDGAILPTNTYIRFIEVERGRYAQFPGYSL